MFSLLHKFEYAAAPSERDTLAFIIIYVMMVFINCHSVSLYSYPGLFYIYYTFYIYHKTALKEDG